MRFGGNSRRAAKVAKMTRGSLTIYLMNAYGIARILAVWGMGGKIGRNL
jgi:hypothetical protein